MARRKRASGRRQGVGALLVVIALLLVLSYLPETRGLPVLLGRWQRVLLGDVAILIPIALFALGATLAIAPGWTTVSRRVAAAVLAILTGIAAYHSRVLPGDEFRAGLAGVSGGVVGAAIVWALRSVVGEPGAWLLIVLAGVISAVLWTGLPLAAVLRGIWFGLSVGLRFIAAALIRGALWIGRTGRSPVSRRT